MEPLTAEQVNEKFKDLVLRFSSYYKYSFAFTGERDGFSVRASYGGSGDDIYKFSVRADETRPFESVDQWTYVQVKQGETEVFSHYDPY